MSKLTTLFLTFVLLFKLACCQAQETLTIAKPALDTLGKKLIIKYDIPNSKPGEKYNVSLIVTDSKAITYTPQKITGDIGYNISGGTGKEIVWDYISDIGKDEIEINITIIINKYPKGSDNKEFAGSIPSRGSLLLQSVALPGLGLSKINDNKPYWIMGMAGYGLFGTSLIFNSSSKKNHDKFLDPGDIYNSAEELAYESKSEHQKTASIICAIGAGVIWVGDLVWVSISSSKSKENTKINKNKRLSIIPDYDLTCKSTLLKLTYTF